MLSTNWDSFISFYMIYIHLFVFLAYLPWVELLRLLSRNDESGHHFLVPDLREEAFRLLFFFFFAFDYDVSCGLFLFLYYVEAISFYSWFVLCFIMKKC